MKKTPVSFLLIVFLAVFLLWYFLTDSPPAFEHSFQQQTLSQVPSPKKIVSSSSIAFSEKKLTARIPESMSTQFALVASAYAEEIKFPSYSQPLTLGDIQQLQPNVYHAQVIPLEKGGSASIELDRYRFAYPEPIKARLLVRGLRVDSARVNLYSELDGTLLTTEISKKNDQGFSVELDADSKWDGPLRIEFDIKSGSQMQVLQTGFEYSQPVARITGLGSSSVDGADLVIPTNINVDSAGHYRLRANLFDADRRPIALLNTSSVLTEGKAELRLRVYKTLLKGRVGPLWLSTFQLERRSAAPGQPVRYGTSVADGFVIEYTGGDQLGDETYQPTAEEQERLGFLQQMAEKK
jgi:hypothetical protein